MPAGNRLSLPIRQVGIAATVHFHPGQMLLLINIQCDVFGIPNRHKCIFIDIPRRHFSCGIRTRRLTASIFTTKTPELNHRPADNENHGDADHHEKRKQQLQKIFSAAGFDDFFIAFDSIYVPFSRYNSDLVSSDTSNHFRYRHLKCY